MPYQNALFGTKFGLCTWSMSVIHCPSKGTFGTLLGLLMRAYYRRNIAEKSLFINGEFFRLLCNAVYALHQAGAILTLDEIEILKTRRHERNAIKQGTR